MPEIKLIKWFSTYGLITAERLMDYYQIKLSPDELKQVLKEPKGLYHQLLNVPLNHILNGIIFQQVRDYYTYAQKLFVDYLLSGEGDKDAESLGANTREKIEEERLLLQEKNDLLLALESTHEKSIANSQRVLIQRIQEWSSLFKKVRKKLSQDLGVKNKVAYKILHLFLLTQALQEEITDVKWNFIYKKLKNDFTEADKNHIRLALETLQEFIIELNPILENYLDEIKSNRIQIKQTRQDIYAFILRVKELLALLPHYRINVKNDKQNLESIEFDADIGEQ